MNLFQKVRHRKSLGRKEKDLASTNPDANPWGDGSPREKENIIGINTSPHPSPGSGETPPPLPAHRSPLSEKKSPFAQSRPIANGQLRRSSAMMGRRQSVLGIGEEDEDTKLMRDSQEAMRRLVADEASSPIGKCSLAGRQQHSMLALGGGEDEDAKLMPESVEALRQISVDDMPRARSSWLNPLTASSYNAEPSKPLPAHQKDTDAHSFNVLPRKSPSKEQFHEINLLDDRPSESSFKVLQRIPAMEPKEDNLLDSANVASMWSDKSATIPDVPPKPKSKVMTPAQFEKYRQEQERLKSIGYKPASEKDDEEDTYEEEDDEDEDEKRREQARQRRKQEAHMTVYRQQMMKITGDVMAGSQRPPMTATQSTPNLELDHNIADPEDEDEDIPLAILQAHGFPNRNRAPGQLNGMSSNPNLRASSQMGLSVGSGSVAGGGNRTSTLPAFARRLPQDPYNYGAGIVNPTNRESLAFGSGSQYGGGGPQRPIAGGLVGVIANEERSRAMRRGSPNAQGEYPAMPANMLGAAPPPGLMNRSSTMPGGPMMQQQPNSDSAMMQAQLAQMQAQLQMNAEMQLQFFNMLSGAPPPPMSGMQQPGGMPPRAGSVYGIPVQTQHPGFSRASTMNNMGGMNGGFPNVGGTNSRPGSASNGRPFTVADPNFPTLGNLRSSFMPAGYAGSITPSERSNVGQPGRYRPISHMPQANVDSSRTSTMMSGGLGNWSKSPRIHNGSLANGFSGSKPSTPTVRILPLEQDNEEDEEKEWEEMRKKKEKKKSMWRMKRKDNDLGDIAHLTN